MIVLAATLWGLIAPVASLAGAAGLEPFALAFWRALIAAVLFALMARDRLWRAPRPELLRSALFGITGIATMYGAFFQSVAYNGAPLASVLLYTGPGWVALIESIGRRHRPGALTLLALALAISGVVVVSWSPAARISDVGLLWGLLSGLAYATHFTIAPRCIEKLGAAPTYAIAMFTGALVLLPFIGWATPPAASWGYLLYVAVGATFLASYAFAAGIVRMDPTRASVLATIEPVVATLASILVLGSRLHAQHMLGAALILTGAVLSILAARNRS